jgi:LytS/YehU family sensor histidine kinase
MATVMRSYDRQSMLPESSLTSSRNKQYWVCQLVGWTSWMVLLIARDLTFVPAEYGFDRVIIYFVSAGIGIGLSNGLHRFYLTIWELPLTKRIGAMFVASLLAAIIWQPLRNFMTFLSFGEFLPLEDYGWQDLFRGTLVASYPLFIFWSGLYVSIKYYQLFLEEKEKNLRTEALAHEAQLRMLRYQLNPHFLFNTLNAISTLVLEKATDPANQMLTKLSKFLRYSLDHSPLDQVTLAYEIESSNLYLDIEKVRFGERMQLQIEIDSDASQAMVPSMLLQPLIENSIKHGISKLEQGGVIRISARVDENNLIISVADNGPGFSDLDNTGSQPDSSGVGLNNIRNRLKEMYGDNHTFSFSNVVPTGCMATVTIPFQTIRQEHDKSDHS